MDIRGQVLTQTQLKSHPTLKPKLAEAIDLRQADQLQDHQGVLSQGPKDILVKVDDKKLIHLQFNVGIDGMTRHDFLAAVRTAITNTHGSLEQVALKKALGDVYKTVMGAQQEVVVNPEELASKVLALEERFSQLKTTQTQHVKTSLTISETRDHRASHLKHAPVKHKNSQKKPDGVPLAEQRQYKIGKLFPAMKGHHLLKSYGLLMAKSQLPIESQEGLRQANSSSTQYLRDFHLEADKVFTEALTAAKAKGILPDIQAPHTNRKPINSPVVLEKIDILLGPLKAQLFNGDPVVREIAPGLCVLDYKLKTDPIDPAFMEKTSPSEVLGKVLDTIGATPSTYIAQKYATHLDTICQEILQSAQEKTTIPELAPTHNKRELFTSTMTLENITLHLGDQKANVFDGEPVIHQIPPGLCALDYKLKTDPLGEACLGKTDPAEVLAELVKTLGATPSIDAALLVKDETLNNQTTVQNLLTRQTMTELGEMAEQGTGIGAMASVAVHLIQGLDGVITEANQENPLLADSLKHIGNLMEVMAISADHPEQFSKAINFLMEELTLVLAITKPYSAEQYTQAIQDIQTERLPSLAGMEHGVKQQAIGYASSGMDALSTALAAARKVSETSIHQFVDNDQPNLNYFEVPELLHGGQSSVEAQPIITAALNPSTPNAAVNLNALADKVKRNISDSGHDPTTLVLDVTIEKNKDELNDLLSQFKTELENGKLNIILCKSYQKYGSLGTGKLMAGNITVINNGDEKFSNCTKFVQDASEKLGNLSESAGKLQQEESQLMTHILKHASGDELLLIQDAAQKAKFIDQFCFPAGVTDPQHVDGLPFVLRDGASPQMKLLQIDLRDSFSFLNTSYLDFNGRINPGHESEARMVEQFYALGQASTLNHAFNKDDLTLKLNKLDLLCFPNYEQHLETLSEGSISETIKTGDLGQIKTALGNPADDSELMKFASLFHSLRGVNQTPQEVCDAALTDLKGRSPLQNSEVLNNIRKFQPSIAASFLHLLTATSPQSLNDPTVINAYQSLIASNFSRGGSDAVSPSTRITIMREWASVALQTPTEQSIALLTAHTGDIPPHQRLSSLENIVKNDYFKTDHITPSQKELIESAIKDAPIREVLSLVNSLITKHQEIQQGLIQDLQKKGQDLALIYPNTDEDRFTQLTARLNTGNLAEAIDIINHQFLAGDAPVQPAMGMQFKNLRKFLIASQSLESHKEKANALLSVIEEQAVDTHSQFNIHRGLFEADVRAPQMHEKDLSARLTSLRQSLNLLT